MSMAEARVRHLPFPAPENNQRRHLNPVDLEQRAPAPGVEYAPASSVSAPAPAPAPAQWERPRPEPVNLSVGEILRRERLHYGKSLEDVESTLRIRASYLDAIEQGDYARLPGRVYASGFVRAYAKYLDLNEDKIIALFKKQMVSTGSAPATGMNFPVAASERRAASPWLFVSSTVLAIAIVAVWVMASRPTLPSADAIPPVPAEITTESAIGSVSAQMTPAPSPTAETAEAAAAPAPQAPAPATPATEESIRQQVAQVDPSIAVAPIETEASPAAPSPSQEITASASASAAQENAVDSATAAPSAAVEAAAPTHRVILKAVESTWIEIRDAQGKTLLSSILKAGDIYFVPDQAGLILSTGNAGGFSIELDGKTLGKLGDTGDVRRDIALDPATLPQTLAAKKQ